ncbi:hypothetical protein [Robbsia sp. KACC 23696]|uniref:hypothetical protein n=1 Tax=Robbsia sp. KACC 23696 TaxID=3149231 RepID=UPI00325AF76D
MNPPDAPEDSDQPSNKAGDGQRPSPARLSEQSLGQSVQRVSDPPSSDPSRLATGSGRALLSQRRFGPFYGAQFLAVLNDHLFTVGVVSVVTFQASLFGVDHPRDVAFVTAALFVLPFLCLSAIAERLADTIDPTRVIRAMNTLEVVIMVIASAGFLMHDARILDFGVLLLGLRATLFRAAKYAYLPIHLRGADIVAGNGWIQSGTFFSILLGMSVGGMVAAKVAGGMLLAVLCLSAALLGRVSASMMPSAQPGTPEQGRRIGWNPLTEAWRSLRDAARDRIAAKALIGIAWLWSVGALMTMSLFGFARDTLHAGPAVVTLLLAVLVAGVGGGVSMCVRLVDMRRGLRFVPLGGVGVTVFAIDLYLASHGLPGPPPSQEAGALYDLLPFLRGVAHWRILSDLLLMAMTGGVCSVPLYALAEQRTGIRHRPRIAQANSVLNAAFIIAAAMFALGFDAMGGPQPLLFLLVAAANAVVIAVLCVTLPGMMATVRGGVRRVR